MANVNSTLSRAQSKPELFAIWLFNNASNWRNLLAFLLVAALTIISIKFNIELGKLSAVDETSKALLPTGYALLDLSALFLSGYIGVKSRSTSRKVVAWCWFVFLLSLSLWAAASFTLSVDARAANSNTVHAIEQKRFEVESLNAEVLIWRDNVANAERFKSKHQGTLNGIQAKQLTAANELHLLESNLPNPTMAIYFLIAPLLGVQPDVLNTLIRLLWAGALTLSPIVIMLLISTELGSSTVLATRKKTKKEPEQQLEETKPTLTESRSTQQGVAAAVVPALGNNQHTKVEHLNGLKYCIEWLKEQPAGRVTRAKVGLVSKIKSRDGVTKLIDVLIEQGRLVRLKNGQLSKPNKPTLRLVKK